MVAIILCFSAAGGEGCSAGRAGAEDCSVSADLSAAGGGVSVSIALSKFKIPNFSK